MPSLLDTLFAQLDSGQLLQQLPAIMRPTIDAWLREHHVVLCGELDAMTVSVTVQTCEPSRWHATYLLTGGTPQVVLAVYHYETGPVPSRLGASVPYARVLDGTIDSTVARLNATFERDLRHELVKELQC